MHDLPFKPIRFRRALLAAGLSVFCVPLLLREGSATTSLPPTPPVTFPFPIHKAGMRVETDLRIMEGRSYRFIIAFMFRTPEARERVSELVGHSLPTSYRDQDGRLIQQTRGIMVPIRLTVHSIDSTGALELLKDERYETQGHESFGANSFSRFIESIGLHPGLYRVSVNTLQDVPEFEHVETKVTIYTRRH